MPLSKLRPSFTLTEDRLKELQAVIPEAFADGRINWDTLREALGETLEDESQEHFGLFWPGKREARRLAALPSKGTLIPQPGAGVDEDNTHNLFIEGDNLEVLKLLQKSYAGRVKLIYIDPPYNTGNDLIYPDDYSEPIEAYLQRTGQLDEEGQLLTSNTKASGRFHSNWLNMIYPRLLLARDLLRKDGVIFVSIDDNEIHNLTQLMNEVFGEENFIANLIWQKMDSPSRNDSERAVSAYHDYILVYSRDKSSGGLNQKPKSEILDAYPLRLPDGRLARRRQLRKNGKGARREDRPTMWFPLKAPDGSKIFPIAPEGWEGRWVLSKETWEEREKAGLTEWIERDYGWIPYYIEIAPDEPTIPWPTIWTDVDQNRQSKAKFTALMGSGIDFDNPKPVNLIKEMLLMGTKDDCICVDFFAGSCSTGHAVWEFNKDHASNHKFILVQLPEKTNDSKYPTIAEIGRERLRRAANQIKKETDVVSHESDDEKELDVSLDLGFRCYKLFSSGFSSWDSYKGKDTSQLELRFEKAETPLVEGWQPENLLSEILLLQGFPLDSNVRSLPEFKGNAVQQVTSEFVTHPLFVCLDKKIKPETVSKLKLGSEDIFVCLDSALSDEAKVKLADQCNLKVI